MGEQEGCLLLPGLGYCQQGTAEAHKDDDDVNLQGEQADGQAEANTQSHFKYKTSDQI